MITRNDKELADIFKRVSEEVMLEQGYPNTMKLGLWVHPYKLIANVCRALATSDMGRSFLKKFVFTLPGSFALSPAAASSLARMTSGFAEIEKPLRSETARERRSS